MASSSFKFIFSILVTILCLYSPLVNSGSSELLQPEYLKVPVSDFLSSLKSTIDTVRNVTSRVSELHSNFSNDLRLSNAISDCLDLLDLSAEELDWTFSASQKPNGIHYGTGERASDFRTWLNGVLVNQETCLEGFDGNNSKIKSLMQRRLNQITSSVTNILHMVHPSTNSTSKNGRKLIGRGEFPSWLKHRARKLIQTHINTANVVVAADGTGNFTSINEAIALVPERCSDWFVIYIKKGVYKEYVEVGKRQWNVVLIGDGIDATVISGNRNWADGFKTFASATVRVLGPGFIARDITFENTAGPEKYQAVAFRSTSDLSVLHRCAFRGYQDTLYAHSLRQFYKECLIAGTVDFIFGRASAVFQNCQILARKGLPKQRNTITANGRNSSDESAFSIQFSNISVEPDVLESSIETYLGRPWKSYSRTVIMQSNISSAIHPRGWLEWNETTEAIDTIFCGEFKNYGPGANLVNRVKWPGFHEIVEPYIANNFTVAQLILGNSWLPTTGIKYTAGLDF
ncbi:hypothetical protein ACH5RR_006277 [Cinchona calisaya]|uniref:Pectinesterase n=1 Tax=Cinchona calisaya TaxID=153742 RepID=A0ABD3ANJ8_9GENT